MAIRPNEAYLGHGRLVQGTVSLNVGGTIYREGTLLDGTLRDTANNIVARIDYSTGRVRFAQNINPTGAATSAAVAGLVTVPATRVPTIEHMLN